MEKKLLTIATINRNNSSGLYRTIVSVLSQRINTLEYIVVDGASNDESIDIAESFGDKIDHFKSESDLGISDAFNKAISRSTGEWILLLNSGDCLIPDTMSTIVNTLEKSKSDIVVFSTVISGGAEDKKILHSDYSKLAKEMSIAHPSTCVRAELYRKFGLYDLKFKFAMDYEFFLRSYKKASVEEFHEIVVEMDGFGISSSNIYKRNRDCWTARKKNGFSYSENLYFTLRRLVREFAARRLKA